MSKNSKIISSIFLIFSLVIFLYVFYKSEIFHNGNEFNYYIKYYIFSLVLIILSLISFFFEKEIKFKISVILISTVLSLYIVEIVLLIIKNYEDNLIYNYNLKRNPDYDFRNYYEAYVDFKEQDERFVTPVLPKHFIFRNDINIYPLAGIPNKPVVGCNENGFFANYHNDRYGFKNIDSEWDKKIIDYVFIGDSSTHGDCVYEADTISGKLRSFQNINGVINLAQGGNDPLIEYATLIEYLPKKKVKNVLMFYHEWNDIIGLNDSLAHPILKKYFYEKNFSQNLRGINQTELLQLKLDAMNIKLKRGAKNQKEIDWQRANKKIYERQELLKTIRNTVVMTRLRTILIEGDRFEKIIDPKFLELEEILRNIKTFLEIRDIKFYFVYVTDARRYLKENNTDDFRYYGEVKNIIKKLNIDFIDLNVEIFDNNNNPFELFSFGKYGGHNNAKGYKKIAEIIYEKTTK
tara:strand:+ start:483 stop:1871 length:1389 start_codon:yes stop_codon:yes gene_type:complete